MKTKTILNVLFSGLLINAGSLHATDCPCDGGTAEYSVDCSGDGTPDACSSDDCDPPVISGPHYVEKGASVTLNVSDGLGPYSWAIASGHNIINIQSADTSASIYGYFEGYAEIEVVDSLGNSASHEMTTYSLNHVTWANNPDPERTTLGLAEFVDLEISPSSLGEKTVWSVTSGDGNLWHEPSQNTASTVLEAPVTSGITTVRVAIDGGVETKDLNFTIIPPNSVHMVKAETLYSGQNYLGVIYTASVFIGPSTVNFNRLYVIERSSAAKDCTGEYSPACTGHPAWSEWVDLNSGLYSNQYGTRLNGLDIIASVFIEDERTEPYVSSSKRWPIPWDYKAMGSDDSIEGSIGIVDQNFQITIGGSPETATLVVSKLGTSESSIVSNEF